MKVWKKIAIAATAVLCAVGMLAGCGQQNNTAQSDSGKTKVKIWSRINSDSTENEKKSWENTMAYLQEHLTDVELDVVNMALGTDYRQEYDKALMAGNAPDMLTEFSYTDILSRSKNGTIADITSLVENWQMKKEDKVLDLFDDAIHVNGKWYAIPRDAYVQANLVNLKAIEQGGGDPTNLPATWDEFTVMGQQITDTSVPRFGYELMGMDWCAWPYTAWVWSAGGEMVRPNGDGTYKIAFTEEPGIDAAEYLNKLIWEYGITQKNVLNSYEDLMEDVMNGSAAYSWFTLTNLDAEKLSEYGLNISDFTTVPMVVKDASIPRPSLAGGEVITFNPKASQETLEGAFKVAEMMYYDEGLLELSWAFTNEIGGLDVYIPARSDLFEKKLESLDMLSDSVKENLLAMRENAIAEPYCPNWTDLKSQLVNPLQEIFLTEGITRDQISKLLNDCADELCKLYPDSFTR